LRVAAVQLNATADTAANMEAADRLTRAAAADGAQLIVLPEKWTVLGSDEDLRAGAQALDGPAISWARALARELSIDLLAGSIVERLDTDPLPAAGAQRPADDGQRPPDDTQRPPAPRLANTSVHVGPDGDVVARYRKIHMFDVEIEGRIYRESATTEPGAEIVLSATAGGVQLGMSICYDLRFPELYRILALRGARVFPLPAAFTLPTTREHWEILVRTRAIENQAFVVAANQVGRHPGGHHSGGHSMIVDPWGGVLARMEDGTGFLAVELDLARQREIRARFPALANRRPDVYRWPSTQAGAGDALPAFAGARDAPAGAREEDR
jgi:predicted amidohydrolase